MIKISNIQNLFVKTLELSFSFLEISDFKTVTSKKRFIFPKGYGKGTSFTKLKSHSLHF
jgi:hypothetical protein